jgi:hypothetical protein
VKVVDREGYRTSGRRISCFTEWRVVGAASCASNTMRTSCVVVLAALSVGVCPYGDAPQVTVKQGTLQGHYLTSRNGRRFVGFQGVPYAKPPLGEMRFRVSQTPALSPTVVTAAYQKVVRV